MSLRGTIPFGYTKARNIVFQNVAIQRERFDMKNIILIARCLLGLVFLIFGLNGFLHFIPMPLPSGVAGQFMAALFVSRYLLVVASLQVLTAVLLLINRYVPLALALLGPIIANILLFHVLMAPSGIPLALIVAVLWSLVLVSVRTAFAELFQARVHARVPPRQRSTPVAREA